MVAMFIQGFNFLWTAPMNIAISLVLVYMQIGWVGFIGLAIPLMGGLCQKFIIGKLMDVRRQWLKQSDQKTKYINEYIDGIRILKYYAWEWFAADNIERVRTKEIALYFKYLLLRTVNELIWTITPILMIFLVLAVYSIFEDLTPSVTFTVLALFNTLTVCAFFCFLMV